MRTMPLLAGALIASAQGAPPTFDAIVIGPPEPFESARPREMTPGGLVVGQASPVEDEYPIRAIFSAGGGPATVLDIASQIPDIAYDANDAGVIAGISSFQAVAWVDGEPVILGTEFEDLDGNPQVGFFGWAAGVNASGMMVGHVDLGILNQTQCVYWPSAGEAPVMLDAIGDPYSYGTAIDVNDAGVIVGAVQASVGGIFLPARWASPDAEAQVLDLPEGFINGEGVALNEAGNVAGRFSDGVNVEPFLYDQATGTSELLGHLDGADLLFAEARDVNDEQMVVGFSNAGPGVAHAFLWIDGEMHDLNDLVDPIDGVMHLSDAVTILDDGRILAEGMVDDTPGMIRKTIVVLTPRCAADVNGDGALNILDFVAFQALFVSGDEGADCDGSGTLNVLDFVCFQGVFQAGCP